MRISILVPCAGSHFKHLESLLELYSNQTSLPDEIVISLSSVETIDSHQIDNLENLKWPFDLKICRFIGKQSPGLNRNIAGQNATGDVFIYQDADDIPHPQRVEVIKHLFETYIIDHLIHRYISEEEPFSSLSIEQIQFHHFPSYDTLDFSPTFRGQMHNGNVACTRKVAGIIPWDDVRTFNTDNDVQFNRNVYLRFQNTIAIPDKLVMWRYRYSALVPRI